MEVGVAAITASGAAKRVTSDRVAGTGGTTAEIREIEEIYRGCAQRMVIAAYGLTSNLSDAQDAVQEAFVRAVASPRRVLAADNPEAWLRTIALNVARSRYRRRQQLDILLRRKPPMPSALPGMSPNRVALLKALRELPAKQRAAIALHHLADIEVAEVAGILGAPVGTVKSWLSRGRATLAGLLGDDRGETDDNA